jgi:hypothetical protein
MLDGRRWYLAQIVLPVALAVLGLVALLVAPSGLWAVACAIVWIGLFVYAVVSGKRTMILTLLLAVLVVSVAVAPQWLRDRYYLPPPRVSGDQVGNLPGIRVFAEADSNGALVALRSPSGRIVTAAAIAATLVAARRALRAQYPPHSTAPGTVTRAVTESVAEMPFYVVPGQTPDSGRSVLTEILLDVYAVEDEASALEQAKRRLGDDDWAVHVESGCSCSIPLPDPTADTGLVYAPFRHQENGPVVRLGAWRDGKQLLVFGRMPETKEASADVP